VLVTDGVVGRKNNALVRGNGNPIILYENLDDDQINVLSCANALCLPYGG
jgi:hypothetical protein